MHWYNAHGRHSLPWRNTTDPYHVYVSEIMLQQTQVASVKERFYPPFLSAFPTLSALAAAPEQDVLKAWQGLGYYRRARYLHAAAKLAAPQLPESIEDLLALPGIGRYTAGAIRCFGHRKRATMVDTNIKRVLSRLTASEHLSEAQLYAIAERYVPDDFFYEFNQALLDIGATICTAKQADCIRCPLANDCEGKDNPYAYPVTAKKKTVPERLSNVAIIKNEHGAIALQKRETAFLGGYYTLPAIESPCEKDCAGEVTQTYSHFKARIKLYKNRTALLPESAVWVTAEDAEHLPMSAIDKKMLAIATVN